MLNVTFDEIQSNPLKYLRLVEEGETVVIIRAEQALAEPSGSYIAEIRPIASSNKLRPFALCAGEFSVPDDFDAPLPEDMLNVFEGK